MTDRELLEAAGKAAGLTWSLHIAEKRKAAGLIALWITTEGEVHTAWNPLEDDGPALRLAVKLNLHEAIATAHRLVDDKTDFYAATRRAIVRAAAEIGKAMP